MSLKIAYHSGPVSLSIRIDRTLAVAGAECAPGGQQRAGEIVDRPVDGLRELRLGILVLLELEGAHAEHQVGVVLVRVAVVLVELKRDGRRAASRLVDLAVGQHRIEGLLQQIGIALIRPQGRPVIGGGSIGIAVEIGLAGREIVAGRRRVADVMRDGRHLRPSAEVSVQQGRSCDRQGSDRDMLFTARCSPIGE